MALAAPSISCSTGLDGCDNEKRRTKETWAYSNCSSRDCERFKRSDSEAKEKKEGHASAKLRIGECAEMGSRERWNDATRFVEESRARRQCVRER